MLLLRDFGYTFYFDQFLSRYKQNKDSSKN